MKKTGHRASGGTEQTFQEQIKAADKREQQSQRLICELTSQVKQLTDAVQSLEEALTLKNGKLKKAGRTLAAV